MFWLIAGVVVVGIIVFAKNSSKAGGSERSKPVSHPPPVPTQAPAPTPQKPFTVDPGLFVSVTKALAAELTPVLFQLGGRDASGMMPGGLVMESTDPSTGKKFSMDQVLIAFIEESSLAFAFGIAAFVVQNRNNTWAKSKDAAEVRSLMRDLFIQMNERQVLPTMTLSPERIREIAEKTVNEQFETAGFCFMPFWAEYYAMQEKVLSPGKFSAASLASLGTVRRGPERLAHWLDDPTTITPNPLALLQARLAERSGVAYRGSNFQATLEEKYGEITRRLIRAAVDLLTVPSTQAAT